MFRGLQGITHVLAVTLASALSSSAAFAQDGHTHGEGHPGLHVNHKWSECSFQIDPALTQAAWRQFTHEAGLVVYFRPLLDARPMGRGNVEVSLLQWATGIDASDAAWNDTFVHPHDTHWLFEGPRLAFPGLTVRAGVTDRIDVGAYATKNPNANYGFFGGQMQYNVVNDDQRNWAASTRLSFTSMFGPEDMEFTVFGADVLASRRYTATRWAAISPYAGVSTFLSRSKETTSAVSLDDENVLGVQGMVGAVLEVSKARLAAEYNLARVNSLSMKLGVAF
jgi:hypothetical protein